jgi:hypothetical protein
MSRITASPADGPQPIYAIRLPGATVAEIS